jgi:hypothetical protein
MRINSNISSLEKDLGLFNYFKIGYIQLPGIRAISTKNVFENFLSVCVPVIVNKAFSKK